MIRQGTLPLLLLLGTWLIAQGERDFKVFYEEGNRFFEAGAFAEAADAYQKAFRIEAKARTYKTEGVFFDYYMPRYKIALCYEKTDIAQAGEWVARSLEAIESDIIKNKKRELADYNANVARIQKSAKDHQEKVAAAYSLKLREAESLLDQRKFAAAKAAFQSLYQMDPSRPEGAVGLGKVDSERGNYLKGLVLDFKGNLLDSNFGKAEAMLNQIAEIDPNYAEMVLLRGQLEQARATAAAASTNGLIAANEIKPERVAETGRKDPSGVKSTSSPGPESTTPGPNASIGKPASEAIHTAQQKPATQSAPDQSATDRSAMRSALLETIKLYRQGDPRQALHQLDAIATAGREEVASYQWLKGLYLLTASRMAPDDQGSLLENARAAMNRAQALEPAFSPNPKLYPKYVLDFFAESGK